MRLALALLALASALVLAPTANAAACPPDCFEAGAGPTALPSEDCPTCVGVEAYAYTVPETGCDDCTTHSVYASAESDEDGVTVTAQVCRGGFFYICPVDETISP